MKQTGLTLGKFAPFHAGHQHLIETALQEVDHLVVVVYQAIRTTAVPLSVRAGWIRTLYPQVEVLEAADGPEETGDTAEVQQLQDSFLLGFLGGRSIQVFFSSEPYGIAVARALGCTSRLVDPERRQIPVSATKIRGDLKRYSGFLNPVVRADLVRRLVFIGGPSTGKSTLAQALAQTCEEPWCPEFGRDYWFQHQVGHRLSMVDLEVIAREQTALETAKAHLAQALLPVDTCPVTTWVYARYYFGYASPVLERSVRSYLEHPREYWLCQDDIPFEDTPDRSGPASRTTLQKMTIEALSHFGVTWNPVGGSLEERIKECLK